MAENADRAIAVLRDALSRLEAWEGDDAPLHREAAEDLAYAYEQLREVHYLLPGAMSWCVVKHYDPSLGSIWEPRVWPHMAFASRQRAEEWADFLSDFYRGSGDRFEAEYVPARNASDHTRDEDRPVGEGYHMHERSGREPVQRWWQSRKTLTWSRIEGHVRCATCRGNGYVPREDRPQLVEDCPTCAGHGWHIPEEHDA